jgi:hypothetical protein
MRIRLLGLEGASMNVELPLGQHRERADEQSCRKDVKCIVNTVEIVER